MKWLPGLLIFIPFLLRCQTAVLKEININSEKFGDDEQSIHYPIVVLQNKKAETSINKTLRKTLLDENVDDTTLGLEAALKKYSKNLLLEMTYKVLFNKNGIISLDVYCDVNGFYDFNFHEYFNFSLTDGSTLMLTQLIKPVYLQAFKQEILNNKQDSLQRYLDDLKKGYSEGDIDKETYDETVEDIKKPDCKSRLSIDNFTITPWHIQVYTNCGLSHRDMRSRYPANYTLQYNIKPVDKWIDENFLSKITP